MCVDSKGNFGKAYSRDMAYAAASVTPRPGSRVGSADELFHDIHKDNVDLCARKSQTASPTEPTPAARPYSKDDSAKQHAGHRCRYGKLNISLQSGILLQRDDRAR